MFSTEPSKDYSTNLFSQLLQDDAVHGKTSELHTADSILHLLYNEILSEKQCSVEYEDGE